ncbi:UNVERIFIED_CONTAM: hypothetical protein K2H54_039001 [Gekko kuhli]
MPECRSFLVFNLCQEVRGGGGRSVLCNSSCHPYQYVLDSFSTLMNYRPKYLWSKSSSHNLGWLADFKKVSDLAGLKLHIWLCYLLHASSSLYCGTGNQVSSSPSFFIIMEVERL